MLKHMKRALAALAILALASAQAFADTEQSFSPPYNGNATVAIAANATPSSVSGTLPTQGAQTRIRICNSGTVAIFFRLALAGAAPTAVTTDPVLLGGSCLEVDGQAAWTQAAVLSSTTTAATVFFTWGSGGL